MRLSKRYSAPVPLIDPDGRIDMLAVFGQRFSKRSEDLHPLPIDDDLLLCQGNQAVIDQLLADFTDLVCADAGVILYIFERRTEAFLAVFIQQPKRCSAFALPYSLSGTLREDGMV